MALCVIYKYRHVALFESLQLIKLAQIYVSLGTELKP